MTVLSHRKFQSLNYDFHPIWIVCTYFNVSIVVLLILKLNKNLCSYLDASLFRFSWRICMWSHSQGILFRFLSTWNSKKLPKWLIFLVDKNQFEKFLFFFVSPKTQSASLLCLDKKMLFVYVDFASAKGYYNFFI